jgi:predicted alpha/beta-fold hydrolase
MASVLMQFRGCSGEPNRLARGYHSGDTGDIGAFIQVLQRRFEGRWLGAVGFSLGGNALLKYLGETGTDCLLSQAVAVSVPFDLARCADRLETGASRVYSHHLLSRLKAKIADRRDLMQASGVDVDVALRCRSFRDFDGAVIAPIFGFADAADYYAQSSCTQFLGRIAVPTLILHAEDDPFMTPEAVPSEADLSASVTLELSEHGGHVGFVSGPSPGLCRYWLDGRITQALRAPAG